jgi:4-hydroxybenzoate polyprenyltransferase
MKRPAILYLRMLRYRVAVMLWMFMLLGAASHGGLESGLVWAALALASSYVAATTLNDVADRDLDRINHPRDAGRPLVSGEATEKELLDLNRIASVLAVLAALPLGWAAVLLVLCSLAIGRFYSSRPILLSYRTYLAPVVLSLAYVAVPYGLGMAAVSASPASSDLTFCAALMALFLARINLKDFRDRRGDALYGRPTLLLRYGKTVTCAVSLVALVVGNALLFAVLSPPFLIALVLETFFLAIIWTLHALWRAPEGTMEQVAIGIGAKMGNGLLLTVLGWLLLIEANAPLADRAVFVLLLSSAFAIAFATLVRSPERAVIGYKG